MSEREQREERAYRHRDEVAGTPEGPTPETEHRDTARGDADERNELHPEERKHPPEHGPTTHPQTRVARREGGAVPRTEEKRP